MSCTCATYPPAAKLAICGGVIKDLERIKQTLADLPEYRNALIAFLEAIRQDEKVLEAMIKEMEDGEE